MKRIGEIDKNFKDFEAFSKKDIKVYDIREEPFSVHGVIFPKDENDCFRRLPLEVAKTVSEGVEALSTNTAGGRVRFATDSDYIAISVDLCDIFPGSNMCTAGRCGVDLYCNENGEQKWVYTFKPPYDVTENFKGEVYRAKKEMKEYTMNLPLYSGVKKMYVIVDENATVQKCGDYKHTTPILYYGSSITQGGCASRPGLSYQSIISRNLDADYVNLGFSGNAKAEDEIAQYIAKQEMSIFVYDYDHNAPTIEHLESTHERMFKIVREANPELPIVCISRPVSCESGWNNQRQGDWNTIRRDIIKKTVDNALKSGDKNVYFIDGYDFTKDFKDSADLFIDEWHPNDIGFMCMAKRIEANLRKILGE